MRKILSLLVLIAAFCVAGFAQSAPVTAKKATLMGDNAQVKDVKTGQVLRIAKASKPATTTITNSTIQISRNGVNTPSNSTSPANGNGLRYMKVVEETAPVLKMKEGTTNQTQQDGMREKQRGTLPSNVVLPEGQ